MYSQGLWSALYGSHGLEIVQLRMVESSEGPCPVPLQYQQVCMDGYIWGPLDVL